MTTMPLLAISPLDGRYHDKFDVLREIVSEYGLIKFRVLVEIRWLQALAASNQLPELPPFNATMNQALNDIIANFSLEDAVAIKNIEKEINHDVKAIEYFIKQRIDGKIAEFIHFACTSEDINNLAYALMLKTAHTQCVLPAIASLHQQLLKIAHDHADLPMLARTHGQPATPTTLGKEFANVCARLEMQIDGLKQAVFLGKMNGACGNYNAHDIAYPEINWPALTEQWITNLGLTFNGYTTQIEPHDYLASYFAIITRINTILIDLSRDVWAYISLNYFTQQSIEKEVGSSTMPHKINPIDFENAEGNLGVSNALLTHFMLKLPISRWQRDLSDSTVLRNIGASLAHALLSYQSLAKGLNKLVANKAVIEADLNAHWEVLAEAVQTVMRRFGLPQPYEQLKAFTRGKHIDQAMLQAFIQTLHLPTEVKNNLLHLTPRDYIGYASTLAKKK